jgi:RluA family pseudouridine synthase
MKIPILTENENWIAVDKPTGLSVHNDEDPLNLIRALEFQFPKLFPVHRLDKETSGVQLLALNAKSAQNLAEQFQDRKIQKFYTGVAAGELPERGVWKEPLSDKAEGRMNPAGLERDRRDCETHFERIQKSSYFSWLNFEIMTGRQHQIRKHCALSGHALIGDPRYGNPKYNQKMAQLYGFDRMALHCSRLILQDGTEVSSPTPAQFDLLFPEKKI